MSVAIKKENANKYFHKLQLQLFVRKICYCHCCNYCIRWHLFLSIRKGSREFIFIFFFEIFFLLTIFFFFLLFDSVLLLKCCCKLYKLYLMLAFRKYLCFYCCNILYVSNTQYTIHNTHIRIHVYIYRIQINICTQILQRKIYTKYTHNTRPLLNLLTCMYYNIK